MTEVLSHARTLYDYLRLGLAPAPSDIMLVFGSIDLDAATYAAELWHAGYSRSGKVIISGGIAHTDDLLATGWDDTEARVFADEMMRRGVPEEAIILEPEATNTGENVRYCARIVEHEGLPRDSILIVGSYMERRILATFEKQWPYGYSHLSVSSRPCGFEECARRANIELDHFAHIVAGDAERMERYVRLGYQTDQGPLPEGARKALEALVALGYTGHMPTKNTFHEESFRV
jgi:hypothetical protein